jgi:glycosyltransferase involved in cell wall biosynthesis
MLTFNFSQSLYILLPVYNRRDVTVEFIKCLQSQKFTNYKLILIDDGSSDRTSEFVTQLLDKDKVFVIRGSGN